MDRGVTLLFRWSFDATFRRLGLFRGCEVFCDFAGGALSASPSSSGISFAEEGEVNMHL